MRRTRENERVRAGERDAVRKRKIGDEREKVKRMREK